MNDEKQYFRSGLASAKFSYKVSPYTSALLTSGLIGGQVLPPVYVTLAGPTLNSYKSVGQFYTNLVSLNQTSVSDSVATYTKSPQHETLTINGKAVWTSDESLDGCGRVQILRQDTLAGERVRNFR